MRAITHNTYELRDAAGQIVERRVLVDGSHEDTRIGLLSLDDSSGWTMVRPEESRPPASGQPPTSTEPADADPAPAARRGRSRASEAG